MFGLEKVGWNGEKSGRVGERTYDDSPAVLCDY